MVDCSRQCWSCRSFEESSTPNIYVILACSSVQCAVRNTSEQESVPSCGYQHFSSGISAVVLVYHFCHKFVCNDRLVCIKLLQRYLHGLRHAKTCIEHMRTAKVQVSPRNLIRVFAVSNRMIGCHRMYELKAKARMILLAGTGFFDLGFTTLPRMVHLYRGDRSQKWTKTGESGEKPPDRP